MSQVDYTKCTITNIRRGKGRRAKFIYAEVRDETGQITCNATLDYIVRMFAENLPMNLTVAEMSDELSKV
jgi:hypothetical protein